MRPLVAPLIAGAFLVACAQAPQLIDLSAIDLNITERDGGARCEMAWLVFSTYRDDVENKNPGVTVTMLENGAAQTFIAAFNASDPITTFSGDKVALFDAVGVGGALVSIIDEGCVKMAKAFPKFAVVMWLDGVPIPMSYPYPQEYQENKGFRI